MNKYDFNDLAAMLRNGASDEEIAEAFSENLNLAKAEEAKRKAEEAAAKELEAKKAEDARAHREQATRLATNAAAALNALLIHEDILRTGEVCFTAKDLLDTIDEARKETANIRSLIDSLADLWNSLGLKNEVESSTFTPRKCKDDIKPSSSDEEIFNELFSKLLK
jgi:vacuolar-type H+-ATPase subunit E/Vma4